MELECNCKVEDIPFFSILFRYKGSVFGGYLRDLIANENPKDINVIISEKYFNEFNFHLTKENFSSYFYENGTISYEKDNHRLIHVILTDYEPEQTPLTPNLKPDFDVNLLAFNGTAFYNWHDPTEEIDGIIEAIKTRTATQLSKISEEMKISMKEKGYEIIKIEKMECECCGGHYTPGIDDILENIKERKTENQLINSINDMSL